MIKEWLSRFFPLDCKCTSMHGIGLKESKRVAVGGSDKERCELTENGIRPQPEGTWLTLCALYVIPTPFNIIWQWPIHPTTNLNIYQNFTHWTSITQTSWTKNLFYVHIPITPGAIYHQYTLYISTLSSSPQKGMLFLWWFKLTILILAFYSFF